MTTSFRFAQPVVVAEPVAQRLADSAVGALTDEATLTPKPGLVDLRGRGAHRDLDWALMCHSAWALHPTFVAMAEAGRSEEDAQALRETIGHLGRVGEATMMHATGGVNTHRGAIWALGLLVTAAARDPTATSRGIASRAGELARCPDRFAPAVTINKGAMACRRYGVAGARGEAAANFPHVVDIALPTLRRARAAGAAEGAARVDALLAIVARLDDTCVLARGGNAALAQVQSGAASVLAAGGLASPAGLVAYQTYDARVLALGVSPGGAADLLAATLFLDRLATDQQGDGYGKTRF